MAKALSCNTEFSEWNESKLALLRKLRFEAKPNGNQFVNGLPHSR